MKITFLSLFIVIFGSLLSATNVLANDYRLVRDCITNGDSVIKIGQTLEEQNPRLKGFFINDSEISAIREAESECAKKTPEEKAILKEKWNKEFSAKYGVNELQKPLPSSGSFDHYFGPGGLFNPIHVDIR